MPFAVYGYTHTQVYYNLDSSLPEELESVSGKQELKDKIWNSSNRNDISK